MLIRRLLLAAIAVVTLLPASGCGCRRCCGTGSGSFAPPPAACCPAPSPGFVPPPGPWWTGGR